MGELVAADAETFTGGRLPDDEVTQGLVDAALAAARRYCGWPVSPVVTGVTLVVDGPGGRVLSLPTLNLITLTSITENGEVLDVTKLDVSRRKGTVEKYPYGWWTRRAGGITVTMTHGFAEVEAADWRRAVLRLVDLMSLEPVVAGERDQVGLKRKKVDNVEYEWAEAMISADSQLSALLYPYRILPSP
jgi:hypothetical protein